MFQSTEPLIIITKVELEYIIKQSAKQAAIEVVKNLGLGGSKLRPASVTQTEAARMLKKSPPTIRKMVRAGVFKLNSLGNIPIEQIDEALMPRQ
jgi:hypothetical protein